MRAHLSRNSTYTVALLIFVTLTLWLFRHVYNLVSNAYNVEANGLHWAYLFTFGILFVSLAIAHREKPIEGEVTDDYVTVIIPAYNEDPKLLKNCLKSLINQSRKPNKIFLVDDGSNAESYASVKRWFIKAAKKQKIEARWVKKENGGKRSAQAVAIKRTPKTSIYVTVDSDSVLDKYAIEEGLKPFSNPEIMSVAGLVLALNNQTNFLARFTDLMFVSGQLVDRSMMSALGSVLVNSGGLAFYRASTVRDNLHEYLNEEFFGNHIEFSDDSMLTLYSLLKGKTVQQPSAIVFTMMPDKVSHHVRQQLRWMRGSFIRSWWRLKYLPMNSFGFIRQTLGWSQLALTTVVLAIVLFAKPTTNTVSVMATLLGVAVLIGYIQALRYLTIRRSDQTFRSQFITFLLAPFCSIWTFFVLRPVKFYAMATCFKSEWGTRKKIEVKLA